MPGRAGTGGPQPVARRAQVRRLGQRVRDHGHRRQGREDHHGRRPRRFPGRPGRHALPGPSPDRPQPDLGPAPPGGLGPATRGEGRDSGLRREPGRLAGAGSGRGREHPGLPLVRGSRAHLARDCADLGRLATPAGRHRGALQRARLGEGLHRRLRRARPVGDPHRGHRGPHPRPARRAHAKRRGRRPPPLRRRRAPGDHRPGHQGETPCPAARRPLPSLEEPARKPAGRPADRGRGRGRHRARHERGKRRLHRALGRHRGDAPEPHHGRALRVRPARPVRAHPHARFELLLGIRGQELQRRHHQRHPAGARGELPRPAHGIGVLRRRRQEPGTARAAESQPLAGHHLPALFRHRLRPQRLQRRQCRPREHPHPAMPHCRRGRLRLGERLALRPLRGQLRAQRGHRRHGQPGHSQPGRDLSRGGLGPACRRQQRLRTGDALRQLRRPLRRGRPPGAHRQQPLRQLRILRHTGGGQLRSLALPLGAQRHPGQHPRPDRGGRSLQTPHWHQRQRHRNHRERQPDLRARRLRSAGDRHRAARTGARSRRPRQPGPQLRHRPPRRTRRLAGRHRRRRENLGCQPTLPAVGRTPGRAGQGLADRLGARPAPSRLFHHRGGARRRQARDHPDPTGGPPRDEAWRHVPCAPPGSELADPPQRLRRLPASGRPGRLRERHLAVPGQPPHPRRDGGREASRRAARPVPGARQPPRRLRRARQRGPLSLPRSRRPPRPERDGRGTSSCAARNPCGRMARGCGGRRTPRQTHSSTAELPRTAR